MTRFLLLLLLALPAHAATLPGLTELYFLRAVGWLPAWWSPDDLAHTRIIPDGRRTFCIYDGDADLRWGIVVSEAKYQGWLAQPWRGIDVAARPKPATACEVSLACGDAAEILKVCNVAIDWSK